MPTIVAAIRSTQNERFVVRLDDGAEIESVLYRGDSLCVSSQVGCAVRCPFCASGARGLGRSLTVDELVAQVALVQARAPGLRRVTVSGVGEPLHAWEALEAFAEHCAKAGLGMSLTTSGGPLPRLASALTTLPHRGLTLSVHAGTEPVRARLVPKGPPLGPLFETLAASLSGVTRTRRKRTALAFLMVAGENDTDDELDAFAERALPLGLQVHLYALNPVPTSEARPVPRAQYEAAYQRLVARGLAVRMSSTSRIEANGGCGTLVALRRNATAARA